MNLFKSCFNFCFSHTSSIDKKKNKVQNPDNPIYFNQNNSQSSNQSKSLKEGSHYFDSSFHNKKNFNQLKLSDTKKSNSLSNIKSETNISKINAINNTTIEKDISELKSELIFDSINPRLAHYKYKNDKYNYKQYILLNEEANKYVLFGKPYLQNNEKSELKELGQGFEGIVYERKNKNAQIVIKTTSKKFFKPNVNFYNKLSYFIHATTFKNSTNEIKKLSNFLICGPIKNNSNNDHFFLIPKINIKSTLKDNIKLNDEQKTSLKDLLLAIEVMNQHGFYQTDANSANVVYTEEGFKLIDFGCAIQKDSNKNIIDYCTTTQFRVSKGENDKAIIQKIKDKIKPPPTTHKR